MSQEASAAIAATVNGIDPASMVDRLRFAFQPIVNVATGLCFGYEALLCYGDRPSFADQQKFFDAFHAAGRLAAIQLQLWEMAVAEFARLNTGHGARLFLNIDSRSLDGSDLLPRHVRGLLGHYDIPESAVTFEITRPPAGINFDGSTAWVKALKRHSCKIAIDRFGGGVAGLQMLYGVEPEFLKIHPFFIAGVAGDSKKKVLLSHVVGMAHLLGIVVIAEGVDSEAEFLTCKEVGCDLVQGNLIEPPTFDLKSLPGHYKRIEELARHERRGKDNDRKIILDQMEPIPPLAVDQEITAVFERLRNETSRTFVPVVDRMDQPLGIVRESNIKNYAYSPFGKDLISNKGLGRKLKDFIVRCPIADVRMSVESIMSIYSGDEEAEGIILVDQMRYVGFLSARSIIRVLNEKNLAQARDQNPLTKLPGNALINQYVSESLADTGKAFVYAYVDFDNFKPFNDTYGFRQGDRAILLFSELMRKSLAAECFLGHIGGDDFFIGFPGPHAEHAAEETKALLEAFRIDAQSFYDPEARQRGCIIANDRDGNEKCFPLLSASAVVIEAPVSRPAFTVDDVSSLIAALKKKAKSSPTKLALATVSSAGQH